MSKMVFVDKSEIPKLYGFNMDKIKEFLERHKNDNDGLDYSILKFKDFWENLDNFGCKDYIFISQKLIRNRVVSKVVRIMRIKCIGGECMPKEKTKMVFVETSAIPVKHAGKTGFDWESLFSQIPDGKAWKVLVGDKPSIASVRDAVKAHNKKTGKDVYDAVQRTENGKSALYVSRIPEE